MVIDYIRKNDKLFDFLEAEILEVREGFAKIEMVVKEKHLNAAKICHGAVIFGLADLAFGVASNFRGKLALAIDVSISYLKPAKLGEKIVAEAREIHCGKNIASYLTEVRNSKGELLAVAKGTVFRTDLKLEELSV